MVTADARRIDQADADRLGGTRWRPTSDPTAPRTRVPVAGTLDGLVRKHQEFLSRLGPDGFRPVRPLTAFDVVGYRQADDPPAPPYAAFKLLDPEHDRFAWLPATAANVVAAMTRHATAEAARHQPREWVDAYVHGHRTGAADTPGRFSYLPIPSLERRGERGTVLGAIRRVLLAEPVAAPASHLRWARQMLPGQFLVEEGTGRRRAMLVPLGPGDWVVERYAARADVWATATPVVLPGSDEGKFAKAERLFAKALAHAGYSPEAVADWELRGASFWPGGELALRFQRPDYLRKGSWSVYHVRLRWRQPITGPLALGAGRHCGLGVFAAC